jgi:hypothetical protein
MELKIIFPGEVRVKKNSMNKHEVYRDKKTGEVRLYGGAKILPVVYYEKSYVEWAKDAVQTAMVYKTKHPEISFPLTGQYNLKCLFFSNENKKVDLSALFEGVQDVLSGNAAGKSIKVPGNIYQILMDDSIRFVGSLDGSRYIYLPGEPPRTEITITEFKW